MKSNNKGDVKIDAGAMTNGKSLVCCIPDSYLSVLSHFSPVTKALQAIDCNLADVYEEIILAKECIREEHDEWSKVWMRGVCMLGSPLIFLSQTQMAITQRHLANAGSEGEKSASHYYQVNGYTFIPCN